MLKHSLSPCIPIHSLVALCRSNAACQSAAVLVSYFVSRSGLAQIVTASCDFLLNLPAQQNNTETDIQDAWNYMGQLLSVYMAENVDAQISRFNCLFKSLETTWFFFRTFDLCAYLQRINTFCILMHNSFNKAQKVFLSWPWSWRMGLIVIVAFVVLYMGDHGGSRRSR